MYKNLELVFQFPTNCLNCGNEEVKYKNNCDQITLNCCNCGDIALILDTNKLIEGLNNKIENSFVPKNVIQINFAGENKS